MLLAIDPGIRGSGAALFGSGARGDVIARPRVPSGELFAACYVKSPAKSGNGPAECLAMAGAIVTWAVEVIGHPSAALVIDRVVFEWPRIYQDDHKVKRTDNNDLLPLPGIGCAVCAFLPHAEHVSLHPDEWKKQQGKGTTAGRILGGERARGRLTAAEQARITRKGAKDHNTLDAIGIGLKHVGRFERHRVIAR